MELRGDLKEIEREKRKEQKMWTGSEECWKRHFESPKIEVCCICAWVCVCIVKSEKEREKERVSEAQRGLSTWTSVTKRVPHLQGRSSMEFKPGSA